MSKIIASLAVLAMLALPGLATAQTPGGNSGVDEYTETTPGAGGNQPTGGDDGGSPGGSPLTPAQVTALEEQGTDGAAAAALAEATGPDRQKGDKGFSGGGSDDAAAAGDDGSGVAEVIGDLADGDGSGMGIALPLILAAALIGAVAFVITRRGGGHTGQA